MTKKNQDLMLKAGMLFDERYQYIEPEAFGVSLARATDGNHKLVLSLMQLQLRPDISPGKEGDLKPTNAVLGSVILSVSALRKLHETLGQVVADLDSGDTEEEDDAGSNAI